VGPGRIAKSRTGGTTRSSRNIAAADFRGNPKANLLYFVVMYLLRTDLLNNNSRRIPPYPVPGINRWCEPELPLGY